MFDPDPTQCASVSTERVFLDAVDCVMPVRRVDSGRRVPVLLSLARVAPCARWSSLPKFCSSSALPHLALLCRSHPPLHHRHVSSTRAPCRRRVIFRLLRRPRHCACALSSSSLPPIPVPPLLVFRWSLRRVARESVAARAESNNERRMTRSRQSSRGFIAK